jgi:hypothetical protein
MHALLAHLVLPSFCTARLCTASHSTLPAAWSPGHWSSFSTLNALLTQGDFFSGSVFFIKKGVDGFVFSWNVSKVLQISVPREENNLRKDEK